MCMCMCVPTGAKIDGLKSEEKFRVRLYMTIKSDLNLNVRTNASFCPDEALLLAQVQIACID